MIIYSSNESGVAYVDTVALDGETNLKEKQSAVEDLHVGSNCSLI